MSATLKPNSCNSSRLCWPSSGAVSSFTCEAESLTEVGFLPTMMVAFDFPTPFSTVGRRNVTNVPAQSLAMMNDPFVHQQAATWAGRLLRELPQADDRARVQWLFESAFGRPADSEETEFTLQSLSSFRALHPGNADAASWSDLCHALFNASEFIYLK